MTVLGYTVTVLTVALSFQYYVDGRQGVAYIMIATLFISFALQGALSFFCGQGELTPTYSTIRAFTKGSNSLNPACRFTTSRRSVDGSWSAFGLEGNCMPMRACPLQMYTHICISTCSCEPCADVGVLANIRGA